MTRRISDHSGGEESKDCSRRSRSRRSGSARRCRPRYPGSSRCNLRREDGIRLGQQSYELERARRTTEEPVLRLVLIEQRNGRENTESVAAIVEACQRAARREREEAQAERT